MAIIRQRYPVSEQLVGPWDDLSKLLEKLKVSPADRAQFDRSVMTAQQQAIMLNQRLDLLEKSIAEATATTGGNMVGISRDVPLPVGPQSVPGLSNKALPADAIHRGVRSISGPTQVAGDVFFQGAVAQSGNFFTFGGAGSGAYAFTILGPYVSVAPSTTEKPITMPVWATKDVKGNNILVFNWQADDNGAGDAQWSLWNVTTSASVLSGSRTPPFSPTTETSTAAPSAYPSLGDKLEMRVSFGGVGTAAIQFNGPALWSVS